METPDGYVDCDPTPVGLQMVRGELERLVECRVLGGLSDREQRRYEELTAIEDSLLAGRKSRRRGEKRD